MESVGLILGLIGFVGAVIVGGLIIYNIYKIGFKYKTKKLFLILLVLMMAVVMASQILWSNSKKQNNLDRSNAKEIISNLHS